MIIPVHYYLLNSSYDFEAHSSGNNSSDDLSRISDDETEPEKLEEIQVGLQADADSLYLQFSGPHLESLKIKRPGESIVWFCAGIIGYS